MMQIREMVKVDKNSCTNACLLLLLEDRKAIEEEWYIGYGVKQVV